MFPKNAALDKTNCLASLVGLRTACKAMAEAPPFFIEDIEGFDVQALSKLAKASESNGEGLALKVISSAAREMMGDIELLINQGYSLKNTAESNCSTCSLLPIYTANSGIKVKAVSASSFNKLQITELRILANVTGLRQLAFNDSKSTTLLPVQLQAGDIMPVKLLYETAEREVRIYFTDASVGLGQVFCPTSSGCGCGTSASSSPYIVSGILAGMDAPAQYGFLPCVSVMCSYDALVCNLIKQTPHIFGLALLYKVGEKLTIIQSRSGRNNSTASYKDGEPDELVKNFGQLYWAKMKGTGGMKGIKSIISYYLQQRKNAGDVCVNCESRVYTSGAIG